MTITPCQRADADAIARAVVMAIGPELSRKYAAEAGSVEEVTGIFARVAALDVSQYSYVNALKAVDQDGRAMGIVVAYDGGELARLRRAFLDEVGLREGDIPDETEPGEYYIDTLAVFPEHRGRGVGRRLLEAAVDDGRRAGLRPGLLVEKGNDRARRLYESAGFGQVGEREFAGELMDHLAVAVEPRGMR